MKKSILTLILPIALCAWAAGGLAACGDLHEEENAPSSLPQSGNEYSLKSPLASEGDGGRLESQSSKQKKNSETQLLFDYLRHIYGQKTLSGAMACVNWNISEAQWVYKHTGRWPAINCFDFIHHVYSSPGGWIDYSNTSVVEDWHRAGGIVAAMWHWNVPANDGKGYAFYAGTEKDADHTAFDVKKIFEPQSSEYALMMKDLDQIAAYLKLLRDKGIPVLWRPLHEAGGQWFWWGRDAKACCELWRVMYDRFQAAGLDNLIWVWTHGAAWAQPFSAGMDWYPGDDYVDIVGFDIYNVGSATACRDQYFQFLTGQCPDKLAALTECGNVPTMQAQWDAGARWLFFMPWYDYGRTNNTSSAAFNQTDHSSANADWWKATWSCPDVLSRDQVDMLPLGIHSPTI